MKVYVGADHRGYHLRRGLINYLKQAGYDVVDEGDHELNPDDDYPVFAAKVAKDVLTSNDKEPRGILICGSGQGICMAANRFKGVRACLGYDKSTAQSCRNDDDSNVLCLPADILKQDAANMIVTTWLNTPFSAAPRHIRRLREIDDL